MLSPWAFTLAAAFALVFATKRIVAKRRRNPRGLPLPPGPKGLPLIGTVTGLPRERPWEGYHKLCQEYGGVCYINVLGQGILVLDSWHWANELLDKRSAKNSNRPNAIMLELMDLKDWNFSLMQHTLTWRAHRRAFHQYFNQNAVSQFHPMMVEERDIFLDKLRNDPEEFAHHIEMFFGMAIMRAAYGIDDPEKNQALIHNNDKVMKMFGEAALPGRFLVNIFPVLRHIPTWFPGAKFHAFFEEFRQATYNTVYVPYIDAMARRNRDERSEHPNMITGLLDRESDSPMTETERRDYEGLVRGVCGMAYLAGAETSVAAATVLFLVLANHPEVQKKAQAELDSVVGPGRLPSIADRPALPYVHAVVKELGRWFTVTPLGVSHASEEDDEYEGYFIPKGTYILPICWAMMHDPDVYESPFEFNPERYLKDGQLDPSCPDPDRAAFGFGRRICPGRHFSNDALFLLTASVLSSFEISPPKDDAGRVKPLELKLSYQITAQPQPFKCEIRERSLRGI